MSHDGLKINVFIEQQRDFINQFGHIKDEFKKRLIENIDDPDSKVFSQDVKFSMAVAETDDDIDLAIKLTKKYGKLTSTQQLGVGRFMPGPTLMQFLYVKEKPSQALDLFNNEDYQSLFMFYSSVSVLMDLLYESGQYDDAIQVYHTYCDHLMKDTGGVFQYPRIPSIIAFACFARMNTKESLENAKQLYETYKSVCQPSFRLVSFLAYLSLQHQEFKFALETISAVDTEEHNITGKNIKMLALLGLNRFGDVLNLFRERSGDICIDVLEQVQRSLQEFGSDDYLKEFMHFKNTNRSFRNTSNVINHTLKSRVFNTIHYFK